MEKTLAIHLQELREQIAQDIEADSRYAMTPTGCICGREITAPLDFIAKHRAASIARGLK